MAPGAANGKWFWCTRHGRAEQGADACPPDDRLGPYESKQAAENWRERLEARNDRWDEQDREWAGESED